MLVFAAFYVAMVAVNAVQYTGAAPGIAGFTLQTLKADVIDVLSVMSYKLFGYPPRGEAGIPDRRKKRIPRSRSNCAARTTPR